MRADRSQSVICHRDTATNKMEWARLYDRSCAALPRVESIRAPDVNLRRTINIALCVSSAVRAASSLASLRHKLKRTPVIFFPIVTLVLCCDSVTLISALITRKAVRDRPLPGARKDARNGSRDVIDHVTIRFPICHFL